MFDVSLVELAVIALVALLVLGPERLPRAARTVGLYVRKARQSWYSVRADIERELAADELKRSLKKQGDDLRESIGLDGLREDLSGRRRIAPPAPTHLLPAGEAPPVLDPLPERIDAADDRSILAPDAGAPVALAQPIVESSPASIDTTEPQPAPPTSDPRA